LGRDSFPAHFLCRQAGSRAYDAPMKRIIALILCAFVVVGCQSPFLSNDECLTALNGVGPSACQ
jgi:hypothetical protein